MVWDTIDHLDAYRNDLLDPAFDWLKLQRVAGGTAADLPVGIHQIDSEALFVIVQDYQTKDSDVALWESHRRYIDVQVMVHGAETIEVAPVSYLDTTASYDAATDKCRHVGTGTPIVLERGQFCLFFPWDAHRCSMHARTPQRVLKYCIKVKLAVRI